MTNEVNKFSDEYAMRYEHLIRRAHQCGRYGVAGANADDYRRLQRHSSKYFSEIEAIKNNTERKWLKSVDELLSDYLTSCGEIKAYIMNAIDNVKKKCYDKLSDEQYNELESIEVSLIKPDIETITKAINRAEKTMLEIGLYPQ